MPKQILCQYLMLSLSLIYTGIKPSDTNMAAARVWPRQGDRRGSRKTCGVFQALWWYWHLCSAVQKPNQNPKPGLSLQLLFFLCCFVLFYFCVFFLCSLFGSKFKRAGQALLMTFDSTCCQEAYTSWHANWAGTQTYTGYKWCQQLTVTWVERWHQMTQFSACGTHDHNNKVIFV